MLSKSQLFEYKDNINILKVASLAGEYSELLFDSVHSSKKTAGLLSLYMAA